MTEDKDIQELLRRKERAITNMGGPEKIEAQHRKGGRPEFFRKKDDGIELEFVPADDVVGVVERPTDSPDRMVPEATERTAEPWARNPDLRLRGDVFVPE